MTCVICGADLPVGAMFCGECGSAVVPRGAEQPAPPPARPAPRASYVPARQYTDRTAVLVGEPVAVASGSEDAPAGTVAVEQDAAGLDDDSEQARAELPFPTGSQAEVPEERDADAYEPEERETEGRDSEERDSEEREPEERETEERETEEAPSEPDPDGDSSSTRVVDLLENDEQWRPEAAAMSPLFPPRSAPDGVDEATRMPDRAKPAEVSFGLHFSTGESVTVHGTGLIGRRPGAQPGEYFDHYVTINDPGRSVSKTHLEFGQDGGAFWISDRYSANGTVVREPDRPARLCPAGMRSRVARGSRVEIGEQFFLIS